MPKPVAPRPPSPLSVLFTCRDNGGLSLMAEAIANHLQRDVRAFSASADCCSGPVDPAAVECLHSARIPADGLSAKPLEVFALPGAPRIDAIVAMVDATHGQANRFASRCGAQLHLWRFEDVRDLEDVHSRRLIYRRLLPELKAAIAGLGIDPARAA